MHISDRAANQITKEEGTTRARQVRLLLVVDLVGVVYLITQIIGKFHEVKVAITDHTVGASKETKVRLMVAAATVVEVVTSEVRAYR